MKKTWNFFTGIIAGIFSIILACNLFAFYSMIHMEKFISQENVEAVLADMKLGSAVYEIDEIDQVSSFLQLIGIPKETLGEVLETEEVQKLLSEYITSCVLYVMFETESPAIQEEDLQKAVVKGFEVAGEKTGMPLGEIQKQAISAFVETYADSIIQNLPTPEQVAEEIDTNTVDRLRDLFSARTKGILFTLVMVCTVLIILVKLNLGKILCWFSVSGFAAGGLCIFMSYLGKDIVINLFASEDLMHQMIYSVGNLAFGSMVWAGIIFFAAAVILQVTGRLAIRRRNQLKPES